MREICASGLTRGKDVGGHWPLSLSSRGFPPYCIVIQGNRIKEEEVRAKSAKHAKDSERGFTQPVDQPINVSFEQISSEMDEQPEFELGKPQIGQYLLTMDTGGRLNRF